LSPDPYSSHLQACHCHIIVIASVTRLHIDHGWPIGCLSAPRKYWAFDVAARWPEGNGIRIAGEIKKTRKEIDALVMRMQHFCALPLQDETEMKPADHNAYRKVAALRKTRAPLFWALGPGGYGHVFCIGYADEPVLTMTETDASALAYPG